MLQALNLSSGPVTQSQMLTLTNLSAGGLGIVDTTGLGYAHHLAVLALNDNPVTNFSGFVGLTNLVELYFNNASLVSLSFMTNVPKLQLANFAGNSISNVDPALRFDRSE